MLSLPDPSAREAGGDTCRDDVNDSGASGNGRKLELICLDSGGAGGSFVNVAARLTFGEDAGGVAAEPTLPAEVSGGKVLNDVGGGGDALDLAGGSDGPKTSSKVVSEKFLGGGDANVPMISVLAVRLKKGLLPLAVDRAGLAIFALGDAGDPALTWREASSLLLVSSSASDFSLSRSDSVVDSCFLLIATRPFCCRASDLSFSI